ncbi:MAG TPA: hypothetical protein VFV84_11595 [Burkholderiales bacterium]|nr:hypothetical protein [Burkholderiales bacterium]
MNATDHAARSFARDAFFFLVLATLVALVTALLLSTLVLLIAGRAEAAAETPASSALKVQAPSGCAAASYTSASFEVEDASELASPALVERCHYSMRFLDAPVALPSPYLVEVRAPITSRWSRA